MNNKVDDAHDNGCFEERRNALYDNTSIEEVNVGRDDGEQPEDDRIHYYYAEAER